MADKPAAPAVEAPAADDAAELLPGLPQLVAGGAVAEAASQIRRATQTGAGAGAPMMRQAQSNSLALRVTQRERFAGGGASIWVTGSMSSWGTTGRRHRGGRIGSGRFGGAVARCRIAAGSDQVAASKVTNSSKNLTGDLLACDDFVRSL